ncbi:MAG TPA: hypothetical protein VH592_13460 [Gemmataceae bacterium]|jgi:hypothetical protein
MPSVLHQRLLNEATRFGTAEVLRQMPAQYSQELEQAIRQGVRQAILYYTDGLESLDRRLHPLGQAGKGRA